MNIDKVPFCPIFSCVVDMYTIVYSFVVKVG